MHVRATALAAAAVLMLCGATACSNGSNTSDAAVSPSPPEPLASTSSPSPLRTPTPTPAVPRPIGEELTFEGHEGDDQFAGSVSVLSYRQGFRSVGSAAEESGAPGYVWAALEVKACSTAGFFNASPYPWTLSYTDGTRIEPASTIYGDFPKPKYPSETKLTVGKCVRGHIVYAVPGNQRPATAVYAPTGLPIPQEWQLPQS